MPVKNALKVLINRFGLVFSIFVFISVVGILLVSLSAAFLPSIIKLLNDAGLPQVFEKLTLDNISLRSVYDSISEVLEIVKQVFSSSLKFKVNTALYVTIVLVFCYRLFLGYYELPAIDVIEAKMSSNMRVGFVNRFISNFRLSTKFIFAKMLYTIIADAVISAIMFGIFKLWGLNGVFNFFLPFIAISVYVLLQALRYSIIALWSPAVAENKGRIFASFASSCRAFTKNFSRFYGCFLITWFFIFVVNVLIGIITFGAGLLLTVPMTMAFICVLNQTLYFRIKNRKYYIDDAVIN